MPDRSRYYLTTAIAYPNNRPGLHTLYEVIGADVIARWHRMKGDDTRFLTGTDEHSVNIAQRAAELGQAGRVGDTSRALSGGSPRRPARAPGSRCSGSNPGGRLPRGARR